MSFRTFFCAASRKSTFVFGGETFSFKGSVEAKSHTFLSRNGTLTSTEWAIPILSPFMRISWTSHKWRSVYCIFVTGSWLFTCAYKGAVTSLIRSPFFRFNSLSAWRSENTFVALQWYLSSRVLPWRIRKPLPGSPWGRKFSAICPSLRRSTRGILSNPVYCNGSQ